MCVLASRRGERRYKSFKKQQLRIKQAKECGISVGKTEIIYAKNKYPDATPYRYYKGRNRYGGKIYEDQI